LPLAKNFIASFLAFALPYRRCFFDEKKSRAVNQLDYREYSLINGATALCVRVSRIRALLQFLEPGGRERRFVVQNVANNKNNWQSSSSHREKKGDCVSRRLSTNQGDSPPASLKTGSVYGVRYSERVGERIVSSILRNEGVVIGRTRRRGRRKGEGKEEEEEEKRG